MRIIDVGGSDVGLIDLDDIIRALFFRHLQDDAALKKELKLVQRDGRYPTARA